MNAFTMQLKTVKPLIIRNVPLKSIATQQNGKASASKFMQLDVNQLIIWHLRSHGALKTMLRTASKRPRSSARWILLEQQETLR